MILGVQELLQIDQTFLRRLFETNPKALLELSIKLAEDLKEARERLDQNPSNSSTPSGNQARRNYSKDKRAIAHFLDSAASLPQNAKSEQRLVSPGRPESASTPHKSRSVKATSLT